MKSEMRRAGWVDLGHEYRVFFPHALARLRALEPYLTWLPLGGQYSAAGIAPLE